MSATYKSNELENFFNADLNSVDEEIMQSINFELNRQQNQIELIASENITLLFGHSF